MESLSVHEHFVTVILSHEIGDGFNGIGSFGGEEVGGPGARPPPPNKKPTPPPPRGGPKFK
jgi:hypothetical protein